MMTNSLAKNRTGLLPALAAVFSLAVSLSAWEDDDGRRARETGPEDGVLCCFGLQRFLFDEDQVLVTTGRAGIFRSEHRGERWRRSMEGLVGPNGVSPQVEEICQAPSQPSGAYAFAGFGLESSPFTGIFTSNNFGKTWTRRAPLPIGLDPIYCQVDPDDARTVYVSASNNDYVDEVWKSTDGGRTVQRVGSPGLVLLGVGRGIVYVGNDFVPGVFVSTDGAATFQSLPMPSGSANFFGFDASPDGRVIFVTTYDDTYNITGTFRSTDRGASYVPVNGLLFGVKLSDVAFDPTDPSRVYVSDGPAPFFGGLLRVSTDGGLNFTPLPASNDPRFLTGAGEIGVDHRGSLYVNTKGGPFRTDDGGRTFRSLLDGFRASAVQDLAFDADGELLVAVLHTQTVFRQTHGRTFRPIGNTPLIDVNGFNNDGTAVAGSPTDASVLVVATYGQGLFRTDNGGRSWTPTVVAGAGGGYFVNSRMAFASSSRVYLVSPLGNRGLYRSGDAGQTFARLSTATYGALAVDPTNPDVLYVGDYGGNAGLFKSTDGGQTLQDLGQPGTFSALAVDRRDPSIIYAGERFGQVICSHDGGLTFAPASTGLSGAGVHGITQDARGTVFVWLRGGGLFANDDGGSTWRPVDTGEALRRSGVEAGRGTLVADPIHPGRLYIGNAGVLQIDAEARDD